MSVAALVVVLALAPGGVEVVGDATCPTPADVAARLGGLVPATAAAVEAGDGRGAARVIVARTEGTMRLALVGANANELATRELSTEGSCQDLAAAAAVVVAAWLADLNPDLTPSVTLPASAPPSVPPPAIAVTPPPPPVANARPFAVGLGLIASDVGGVVAPGAMLVGALGLDSRDLLALDASLSGTTSRSAAVGTLPGAASWTRATLALGPALRLGNAAISGDVHLQALAALLHVRGVGVPNAASDTTAQLGVGAGARIDFVTGTSAVWLGLDVFVWPGDQRLLVENVASADSQLPRLELVASVGISLGRFP
jgi:hypothetical protein